MADILTHLLALNGDAAGIIRSSVSDFGTRLGELLQLDADVQTWAHRIEERPEVMQLGSARRELGFAIFAASSGLYAHAYAGLRLFLELSFASVYFSANELHRRRWISDREHFSWSNALDSTDGLLAKEFVQEFNSDASVDAVDQAKKAADAYRHCSQFVHGKLAVTKALPEKLEYASEVLDDWLKYSIDSAKAVIYLLYVRYGEELLSAEPKDGKLEATLEHSFGHLSGIRKRLGLPVEGVIN